MNNILDNSIDHYLRLFNTDLFLNSMFNNMFEGAFIVDLDKNIHLWNQTAEQITGYTAKEITSMKCANNGFKHYDKSGKEISDNDYLYVKCFENASIVTKKAAIIHKKGFLIPVLVTVIPIKNEEDIVVGALEIFLDDSAQDDLDKAHERLKEASIKDGLTNLFTRSEMIERIEAEIEKADRYEVPVCLCICDIDDFKKINDKYGSHVGDIVIRTIADVLRHNLRRTDIIARYGGEEFIILLPLIDLHRAAIAIEKLKRAIDNTEIDLLESKDKVHLSYGLTEIVQNDSLEDFIDRAESALYKAKKLGKNMIEIFT
ncbi:MAG: diguanylate cyclase [Cyanobacteriota bacterium]